MGFGRFFLGGGGVERGGLSTYACVSVCGRSNGWYVHVCECGKGRIRSGRGKGSIAMSLASLSFLFLVVYGFHVRVTCRVALLRDACLGFFASGYDPRHLRGASLTPLTDIPTYFWVSVARLGWISGVIPLV